MPTVDTFSSAANPDRRDRSRATWPASSARPPTSTTPPRSSSGSTTCKPFDVIRFAQKACSNLAILDLVRRHGVLVDAVSAGEIRPRAGGRLSARTAIRRRSSTRPTSSIAKSLDLVVEHGHPRQLRLARHDRPATASGRPAATITLRINPGFGHGHSQKTNTGGEQSKHGIWHEQLGDCLRRADQHGLSDHRAAHAHRLGHRPGAPARRSAARWRRRPARSAARSTTISAGGGLPIPYRDGRDLRRHRRLLQAVGRHAQAARGRRSATSSAWRSSRAATWSPRAATWSPRSAPSSRWAATRSICSTPASTTWPGRFSTAPITRCRSCPADGATDRRRRCATSSSAARSANRATSSRRTKAASSARASCPRPRSATSWSSNAPAPTAS